ncbi:MAG: hypothetical protein KF878_09835 [Planctomycetes bacterium]|nr:hypothetical protein [Planctomycetota bacterium]
MSGPSPTFASIWEQAGKALHPLDALQRFGSQNDVNWADLEAALTSGLDGVYTPDLLNVVRTARRQVAAPLSAQTLRAAWRPVLQEICRAAGLQELSGGQDLAMLRAVRQFMVDEAETIKRRALTFDTPAAGSNTGNGAIYRVTVDKDGHPLPTGPEAKLARITKDAQSEARKHAEVFTFTGAPEGQDNLAWEGSGFSTEIETAHPLSSRLVRNPSFDTNGATADDSTPSSATAINSWTLGDPAHFKLRSAAGYAYASYPGAPQTLWGLEFVGSGTISQVVTRENPAAAFRTDRPYFVGIRYRRKANATGTLHLDLGASTASVDLSTAPNDQWAILFIPLDAAAYFQQFNETDLAVKVRVTSLATGTVVVDHLVAVEMENVDGTFYLPVGGDTAFLAGDSFAWEDTETGRAVFATLLWLAYGADGWLPSAAGDAETVPDPVDPEP